MIALLQNEEVTNLEIDSLLDKFIRLKISRYEAYNSLMEILREYEVIMVEKILHIKNDLIILVMF